MEDIIDRGKTLAILGSSYTGKTTLLVKILNETVKKNIFDIIILFTLSPHAEPLKKLDKSIIRVEGLQNNIVNLAFNINRKTNNRYNFLFVLDDILNVRYSKVLEKMFLIYRNSGISTIMSTQYAKIMSVAIRNSVHRIILTGSKSFSDRELLGQLFLYTYLHKFNKAAIDAYIIKNTKLDPNKGGKFILIDNVKVELSIHDRPKL